MSFLDDLFDFNFDGKADSLEKAVGFAVAATMIETEQEEKQRESEIWCDSDDDDV